MTSFDLSVSPEENFTQMSYYEWLEEEHRKEDSIKLKTLSEEDKI